jgi:prophage tail gpP-like protein
MSDLVRLTIGGTDFGGWEGVTITRALDTCADAFSMSAPFDPGQNNLIAAFRPFGYQPATVKIDNELILTGTIEAPAFETSAGVRAVTVQGRSLTGPLVECSIDGVGYQFDGLTLATIAKKVCQPFGVQILAQSDSQKIKEARAEPGESVFEFLGRLASNAGLLLTCDAFGKLVLAKIQPKSAPIASLVEGRGNLLSVSSGYDGTKRHSIYKILQQQDGTPGISGKAVDSGVRVYRPKTQAGSDSNAADIKKAAAWARALALAESVQISATLTGWRSPSGALWKPGSLVTMQAPGAFILRDTALMIAEATLSLDTSNGLTTTLRLVLPATYTGEMPEVYPWA